jgi:hypothetical protein
MEWGWPEMMVITTGTVDRESLQEDCWKPESAFWTALGIPWVRDNLKAGDPDMKEHPLGFRNKVIGDDIQPEVQMIASRGRPLDITITK